MTQPVDSTCIPAPLNHARYNVRIAIVTTSYPSHSDDPAGHFVRAEAQSLAFEGHDVHVIAPEGPQRTLCSDAGIRPWPLPHGGAFGWPGAPSRLRANPLRLAGATTFIALAVKKLRRLQPSRIIAHWLVPCVHPIVSASGFRGEIEAVAHGADVRMLLGMPAPLRKHMMARVLRISTRIRFAAHTIYENLMMALPLEQQRLLSDRMQIGPPEIIMPDISSAARELRSSRGSTPFAVTVARLVESKRVDLAIQAVHQLYPRIHLGVLGDGPDRQRLTKLAAGAQFVHFEGTVPRSQALAWIAAADVLVHTSTTEAAPTVIREARMLGTPVVACDAGDVARWAKRDKGIALVEPNASAIAETIDRVVLHQP